MDESTSHSKSKEKNFYRESREKNDYWRIKEAIQPPPGSSRDMASCRNVTNQTGSSTPKSSTQFLEMPGLLRYRPPRPQISDYHGHRPPPMTAVESNGETCEFYNVNDHPVNRRGFRYSPCEASQLLVALAYRGTEYEPFKPRINFEDMNGQINVTKDGTALINSKGWRMARANVGVREGDWYYECEIINGINGICTETQGSGHVRIGWARREAPLDAPVGFDAYSYGLRDQSCQKVHMSRPKDFVPGISFATGDVIGMHISLPPLAVQRELSGDPTVLASDIIRDRVPIRFKNQLWFEHFEFQTTKEFEDLMNPLPGTKQSNKPLTLPESFIKVYRNGEYIGTAFENLYAFLPPASKPMATVGGRELDDGTLGYYPAVSVFMGGIAKINFGPNWHFPPRGLRENVKGMCDRYNEQIAEDVAYDLLDEIDLLFSSVEAEYSDEINTNSDHRPDTKEVIKEMVIDDE